MKKPLVRNRQNKRLRAAAKRPTQRPASKARVSASKPGKPATPSPRAGSKSAALLEMLTAGTTVQQVSRKFGWLAHTSRAAITMLQQRLGLTIESSKAKDEDRVYRVAR